MVWRCCYATTGVPIVLAVDLNGHPMGAELPAVPEGQRPRLRISCQGTNDDDGMAYTDGLVDVEGAIDRWPAVDGETDLRPVGGAHAGATPAGEDNGESWRAISHVLRFPAASCR